MLVTDDEAWNWKTLLHDSLRISPGCNEEILEVLHFVVVLIALITPHRDLLAMENHHMEECIQEENRVRIYTSVRGKGGKQVSVAHIHGPLTTEGREVKQRIITPLTSSNPEERAEEVH